MDALEKFKEYVITEFLAEVGEPVIERGHGAVLVGRDGREYIDAFAGIAVANAGHANPEIVEAARSQMEKLIHCGTYLHPHAPAADLAEMLSLIAPGRLKKSFFGNSGAEANEAAIRLAKQHTGRTEFISLWGSFHGRTLATLSLSGMAGRKRGGGPYMPGVAFAPAPYCYRCPFALTPERCGFACAEAVEEIIRCATSGDVAAMIVEPVQGEGGIIVPPKGYFAALAAILEEHDILLIVDEVQTGFCRTGSFFAIEQEGVEPDLMTLGKGIAGGFPLSAMMTRPEIAAAFKPGDHLSTFGGNPVCCAAALAAIEFYRREEIADRSRDKGAWLLGELQERLEGDARVGDIRGRGLMIGVELVSDREKTPAADLAKSVRAACVEKGLLVGVGGLFGSVLRIQPPLVIEDAQLEAVADILHGALEGAA
jgi:4-aminobutyrate aminotransferase